MKKTEKEGKAMMTRATRPKKENQRMTKNPGVILALCIIGFDVIKIVTAILTVLTGIWPHEYARGLGWSDGGERSGRTGSSSNHGGSKNEPLHPVNPC